MAKSMVENGFSADKIRVEVMKMLRADKDFQMAVAENTIAYKREVQQSGGCSATVRVSNFRTSRKYSIHIKR